VSSLSFIRPRRSTRGSANAGEREEGLPEAISALPADAPDHPLIRKCKYEKGPQRTNELVELKFNTR